jgi:hypothetical protein
VYGDIVGDTQPMNGVPLPGGNIARFQALARPALVAVGLASWNSRYGAASGVIELPGKDKVPSVSRFLNRLLGLPLSSQTIIFQYFTDTFEAVVARAKSEGKWDEGLVALKAESIKLVSGYPSRIHTCPDSGAETHVVKLALDRGVPFASAQQRLRDFEADAAAAPGRNATADNTFYISDRNFGATGKRTVILATEIWNAGGTGRRRWFRVVRVRLRCAVQARACVRLCVCSRACMRDTRSSRMHERACAERCLTARSARSRPSGRWRACRCRTSRTTISASPRTRQVALRSGSHSTAQHSS